MSMKSLLQPQLRHNLLRSHFLMCKVHADDLLCQLRVNPSSRSDLIYSSLTVHILADPADNVRGDSSFIGVARSKWTPLTALSGTLHGTLSGALSGS